MVLQTPPSLIENKGKRFLVFDAPSDGNLHEYMKVFRQHNVSNVVRVCDSTYNTDTLKNSGIAVHDWSFPDGDAPPPVVVNNWLNLVRTNAKSDPSGCIGIHCVAGLGRAPVLVAVALIEDGMSPEDAVVYIRKHRRGAINSKQIKFLQKYKPQAGKGPGAACCVVM